MKKTLYTVPGNKKIRVIIDTDAYAEADDQFAIVHALLTPKFDVVGIVAEQFGTGTFPNSMEKSYEEINKIVQLMGLEEQVPVFRGEEQALRDEKTAGHSEGAQFIVEEALKQDDRPLFVLNIGAITNLAAAYLLNPEIADKLLAVWVGGGPYPTGHMDFNSGNDLNAVNVILSSEMELWQIPLSAYTMMEVSFHELFDRVKPCGELGNYLVENLLRVNELECGLNLDFLPFAQNLSKAGKTMLIRSGEGWSLGDNPAIGVLISPQTKFTEERRAQRLNADGSYGEYVSENRTIRVYHSINSRVILEDLFAKIRYHFGE
ncbi:nucleoside hydrolase [Trichococcus ilyis]|uniref:Inosine-uridine preferring nucleoside hydrolase n=1 Tax=Trichococcus ilyis TaxID=640938 RepID=A0A143Z408_9LACT|nr:nucleoside hydrolase [Trichococcus ilyis]CZR07056.1 inosine-uridine preferring nucleoside hydrolase [Trichococcus ilyis]SEJ90970.1 Inosine-uridine preferring nucleoside hydrolase [Trichococcus ilyis]